MKCLICEKEFTPVDNGVAICEDCKETHDELTNGKEQN